MSIFDTAIGLMAPAACVRCDAEGLALCTDCANSELNDYGEKCGNCGILSRGHKTCINCRRLGLPNHMYVVTRYEELAKSLIARYKFNHQRAAVNVISDLMTEKYLEANPEHIQHLVVAIPTATKRVRERSFDHAALLAKEISRSLGLKRAAVLARLSQHTQIGANRILRSSQVINDYYIKNPDVIIGRRILLVDDVTTTGSTLRSASVALRKSGAKSVDALIFAKKV